MAPDLVSWIDTLDTEQPPEVMTDWVRRMLVQAFQEAFAPGGHLGPRDKEEELLFQEDA
jgi:hypothetical protein